MDAYVKRYDCGCYYAITDFYGKTEELGPVIGLAKAIASLTPVEQILYNGRVEICEGKCRECASKTESGSMSVWLAIILVASLILLGLAIESAYSGYGGIADPISFIIDPLRDALRAWPW